MGMFLSAFSLCNAIQACSAHSLMRKDVSLSWMESPGRTSATLQIGVIYEFLE